jgi:hypothetical protein
MGFGTIKVWRSLSVTTNPFILFLFLLITKNTAAYLLKVRTVEAEKQPLLGDARTKQ